jgi:Bpu10I restriction endonuclease
MGWTSAAVTSRRSSALRRPVDGLLFVQVAKIAAEVRDRLLTAWSARGGRCAWIASGAHTMVPSVPRENQPHGGKLDKLRQNTKLPEPDRDRVEALWVAYENWLTTMDALDTRGEQRVEDLVLLYRQDGQLKLRGSVLEEFLPRLVVPEIIDEARDASFRTGSATTLSSFVFDSVLVGPAPGEGLTLVAKDQDFAITRPVLLTADSGAAGQVERTAELAFLAAEC